MLKRILIGICVATLLSTNSKIAIAEDARPTVATYDDSGRRESTVTLVLQSRKKEESTTSSSEKARVCQDPLDGRVIACNLDGAWWDARRKCYVSLASPQPDLSHYAWEGNTEGVIFICEKLHLGSLGNYMFWMPNPNSAPNPVDLAE